MMEGFGPCITIIIIISNGMKENYDYHLNHQERNQNTFDVLKGGTAAHRSSSAHYNHHENLYHRQDRRYDSRCSIILRGRETRTSSKEHKPEQKQKQETRFGRRSLCYYHKKMSNRNNRRKWERNPGNEDEKSEMSRRMREKQKEQEEKSGLLGCTLLDSLCDWYPWSYGTSSVQSAGKTEEG